MLKQARTLSGVEHTKYEAPSEFEVKMQSAVKTLEDIIAKNSEVESQTIIINMASTNDHQLDIVTSGCIFGCLTSRNREQYAKFSKLLQQTASLNPSVTLTPINFIIIERFWYISDIVRQNLITLLNEMTNWRLTRIEIVLGNALRQFMDFGPLATRYQPLLGTLRILKHNSEFLFKSKESGFLIATTISVCMHYLIEIKQCPSDTVNDSKRILLQILELIMTIYFDSFQAVFGRNSVLILTMLSRYPEIAAIWKQLILTPTTMGVLDLLRRSPEKWLEITVLPLTTTRKFEFLHHTSPELTRPQFRELFRNLTGPNTEGSMKALCLRAFLNPNHQTDPQTMDVRAMHIANLLSSCKTQNESYNFVEFQTCKMAFFIEWLGYDAFPPNFNLPLTIVTSWKAFFHICTTNGPLLCSLYEFLILLVQTLYPPLTPVFVKSITRIIQCLSKNFPVSTLLDSTKIEKPLRELFKETFPELAVFFRKPNNSEVTTVPVSPMVEKAPQISVTSVIDPIETPTQQKEAPPKPRKKSKKRPAPVITLDDEVPEAKSEKNEAGWDSSLGETIEKHMSSLSDDIKEELLKLQNIIKEGGDGVVEIEDACGAIVRNRESLELNDELKDAIADCFLIIFKKFLMEKKFFVPKDDEKWDVRETFKQPFYIIFKQVYTNDEPAIIFSILESMYSKLPIVGYLLLFYILVSKIQDESDLAKDEYTLAYQEFCNSNNKEVSVELAQDMEACAIDDYKLFKFMLPKVFEMFGKDAIGSEPLIRTICTHCDSSVILDLTSNTFCENLVIFRRDSFVQLVTASLEWEEYEQVFFWDLVKGEGIAFEWIVPVLPKLDFEKHSRACYHALVMMRTYGEPNMATLRPLISRPRGDMFVLNALKILVQDDGDCQKLTATLNNLMKKSIEANDFFDGKKAGKQPATKKTIPLQTILGHLDLLRRYCFAKPSGQTEKALKEFVETFSEIKTNSACSELVLEFDELFVAVDILSGPSGRNLRKNRQKGNFEVDDKGPSKRRRIKDDSDED
uniref:SOSS complex subunit A homolog n=1 Tax=Panagrolaimus sp. PS1159 TaxID=55785 RepID=A0AC35G1X9_9BILA